MTKKQNYEVPETEVFMLRPEKALLTASTPSGTQTKGFTQKGSYDDEDWDID